MRTVAVVATAALLVVSTPSPTAAWGFAAHKFIMARAIDALPAPLKAFAVRHRDELLLRVTDPDLWRTAGWNENANHFLNFGVSEYGRYPFAVLPREYGAAIEKFGTAELERNGLLPWRVAEEFGNLRRAFASGRMNAIGASDIVLFASVAGHYIQDAYQPFHATENYDGQLTGNRGIHTRFETTLVDRFEAQLSAAIRPPAGVRPMTNARDAAFDALLASHQAVDAVLRADTESAGNRRTYDNQYYDRMFGKVRDVLEERLSSAVAATVALLVGAWEQAGRPAVP